MFLHTVLLLTSPLFSTTTPLHSESDIVEHFCTGIVEYLNSDGTRTDCYISGRSHSTSTYNAGYSIEYDFAPKWYECLGQSMHYGLLNDNQAVCALIVRSPKHTKFVQRLVSVIAHYELPVYVMPIYLLPQPIL